MRNMMSDLHPEKPSCLRSKFFLQSFELSFDYIVKNKMTSNTLDLARAPRSQQQLGN